MAKDPTLKKKRKSEAIEGGGEAVEPVAIPPAEGTASAEAVVAEVENKDAEKAAKKAKKEKRKSVGVEGEATGEKEKVSLVL